MKRYLLTILLSLWCVCAWAAGSVTVRGRVLCGGRGVEGVWVSDGEEFACTDKRGNYRLQAGADNRFVFVCVPAGYDAPVEKGVVRYFHPLPADGKSCDFTLLRRAGDDSRYGFIAIADPQIWAPKEFAKLAAAADDIAATVHSVSPAEDGRCVVVLACREYLAETTQLRHQTAQIVLHSYTGLRLPSICLRQSEDGTLGVYCAQGGLPQFKPVNMVYQGDDYVLVSVPTGTGDRSILRPGDEVLMTGVTLDGTQILTGD